MNARATALVCLAATALAACAAAGPPPSTSHDTSAPADAPVVAVQPGAWFDSRGNLTVVGPGHRLRLVLSAPISACTPAFEQGKSSPELVARASLPFHVLSEVCREAHPTILLAEESETASPAELERSYHEVAHCAAADWGVTDGWIPSIVSENDPCPLALGLGWRLPNTAELTGLTVDDRKAIAGALFDTEDRTAFGNLLLYARGRGGALDLVTLSPNAAEQAPTLTEQQRMRAFSPAGLRCVHDGGPPPTTSSTLPVLPHAAECLREQRQAQGLTAAQPVATPSPDLQKLKAWVNLIPRNRELLRSESSLRELSQLLAAPGLERLASEAREERALTERYSELAESLDDPAASPGERARRRAEFDGLRKRLGGQIVRSAETSAGDRTELGTVLERLRTLLETNAAQIKSLKKASKLDYRPLLARVQELRAGKASKP